METIIRGALVTITEANRGDKTRIEWITQIEDIEIGGYALVDNEDLEEARELINNEAKSYIEEYL